MRKINFVTGSLVLTMVFSFGAEPASSQAQVVTTLAKGLLSGVLSKVGGKAFDFIFGGGDKAAEPIDYDKIAGIMKSELSEHDYKLAIGQYNEHLNGIRFKFKSFKTDWNKKGADRQALAARINADLDLLNSDADNLIGNYPVQGIYLYGAIQTLRLAIIAGMAQERDVASGFGFDTFEREVLRVRQRIGAIDLRAKRLEFIACDGEQVFDTFVSMRNELSGKVGGHCAETVTAIRSEIGSWGGSRNEIRPAVFKCTSRDNSLAGTIRTPSKNDPRGAPPKYTPTGGCSSASVSVSTARIYYCDNDTSANRDTCRSYEQHYNTTARATLKDANARADYAYALSAEWGTLSEAARVQQRIASSPGGDVVTSFKLVNNTGETIEVKWHSFEGQDGPLGSKALIPNAIKNGVPIPNGGTWSPSGGEYTTSSWFGIYLQDPTMTDMDDKPDCDGIYGVSRLKSIGGCRSMLLTNFNLFNDQRSPLIVNGIVPEANSERAVVWIMDPPEIRYTIKDYIMQINMDGTEDTSTPVSMSECKAKCEGNPACVMIRYSTRESDCYMGSSLGPVSNTEDDAFKRSARITSRTGNYFLRPR